MEIYSIDNFEADAAGHTVEILPPAPDDHSVIPMTPELQADIERTANRMARIMRRTMSLAVKPFGGVKLDDDDEEELKDLFYDLFDIHPSLARGGRIITYIQCLVVPAMIVSDKLALGEEQRERQALAEQPETKKAEGPIPEPPKPEGKRKPKKPSSGARTA